MEIQRINIKNMEIKMEKEKTCKIVFSDIDGTLLTSDGQITEGTKEMILNLENKIGRASCRERVFRAV